MALYLSYKLDDPDEDVERGVSGHHAARALWEQSRHNAQETTRQTEKKKTFTPSIPDVSVTIHSATVKCNTSKLRKKGVFSVVVQLQNRALYLCAIFIWLSLQQLLNRTYSILYDPLGAGQG